MGKRDDVKEGPETADPSQKVKKRRKSKAYSKALLQ